MAQEKTLSQTQSGGINYRPIDELAHEYANNVQLLSSNWDLELIFGQLDQMEGPNVVSQHTSITIPWQQVKALHYLLGLQLIGHEADFGRIIIPPGIIPEVPLRKPKEFDRVTEETWKRVRKHYEDFIHSNPEAGPQK